LIFEVQHYTLVDGWINCWTDTNEKGEQSPVFFKTYTQALKELTKFVKASKYDINEFRIMEVNE
jgi:uncharacterized protein involved in tolerance to divalent cations